MTDDELAGRIKSIPWFQDYPIRGIWTGGPHKVTQLLPRLGLPDNLGGKNVFDFGSNDGFFAFECERRGAANVWAIDHPEWGMAGFGERRKDGFLLARQEFGSKVKDAEYTIESMDEEWPGPDADLVLCLGIIYHLRDMPGGLQRMAWSMAPGGLLIVETHVALTGLPFPAARYYPGAEFNADPTNHWGPNPACVLGLLRATGLTDCRQHGPAWEVAPDHWRAAFHATKPA